MSLLEAVGWIGSAVLVISLLQTRVMRFRVLNLASCVVLIGYNAAVEVWPMAAMNVVLVGINIWAISRLTRERHDARAYDAVPIATDEPFLRHLLTRHAADVAALRVDRAHREVDIGSVRHIDSDVRLRARDRDRQPGAQGDQPGDVCGLGTLLQGAPPQDVVDFTAFDAGPLERGLQRQRSKGGSLSGIEGAPVGTADRRAGDGND